MISQKIVTKRKKLPYLSIIIPAFNTKPFYKACLESLLRIDYPDYEIIVVDDGSSDGSFEAIKKIAEKNPQLKLIQTLTRRGIPRSRNIGIEASKGELIAFFDMDMEVTSTWPNELIKVLIRHKDVGGVLPKVLDFHKRKIIQSVGGRIIPQTGGPLVRGLGEKDTGQYDEIEEVSINAAGAIIKKGIAQKLGGYDETLGMYDDIDFGWRMWIYGWRSLYVPAAYIYHWTAKPWSARPGSSKIEHEYFLDNAVRVIIKNFELKNVIRYLPQALVIMFLRVILNLMRGNLIPLLGATKALLINLIRLPLTLKERNEIQTNRKLSDEKMMGKVFVRGSYLSIYINHIRFSLQISRLWYDDKVSEKMGTSGVLKVELRILLSKILAFLQKRDLFRENRRKVEIIKKYALWYHIDVFLETGTYAGDTVNAAKGLFEEIYSIELDSKLYLRAKRRFKKYKKIKIIQGDSAKVLPQLLKEISRPTLFWLDAHCSGGLTTQGNLETPVKYELISILKHSIKKHVILLDDANLFVGTHDYPTISWIRKAAQKVSPGYKVRVKNGIIQIINNEIYDK